MSTTAPTPAHSLTPADLERWLYRHHETAQHIVQAALTHGYVVDAAQMRLLIGAMDHLMQALGDEVLQHDTTLASWEAERASLDSHIAVLMWRKPEAVAPVVVVEAAVML